MLNSYATNPFTEVDGVGIAIKSSVEGQNHIGILYLDEHNEVKLIHFGTHNRLYIESPANYYFWIDLGAFFQSPHKVALHSSLLEIVSHFEPVDAQNNPNVPFTYGFDSFEEIFSDDGTVNEAKKDAALTCASFVLGVFSSLGYSLLKVEEWPLGDPENEVWQKNILGKLFLEYGLISQMHYEEQLAKVGARRFLPEEVAAGTQLAIPASRDEIVPVSNSFAEQIRLAVQ